jgi:nucleoside-triphosphatase THEP1
MSCPGHFTQLCAIRRSDPIAADTLTAAAARRARAAGLKLAGVLQRDLHRPGRRRCDMDLIDLATGRIIRISEDRGNLARGCRMNTGALAEVAEMVEDAIRTGAPDLVILNKFAKAEEEGGGMRDAIAAAVSQGIPLLMSVGTQAVPALEQFAGELVTLIDADEALVGAWLSAHFGGRIGRFLLPGEFVSWSPRADGVASGTTRHQPSM